MHLARRVDQRSLLRLRRRHGDQAEDGHDASRLPPMRPLRRSLHAVHRRFPPCPSPLGGSVPCVPACNAPAGKRWRSPFAHAVKNASTVQQTAASPAAIDACGICVFTWSIRSQPVHTELSTVVSEIGEHWSP